MGDHIQDVEKRFSDLAKRLGRLERVTSSGSADGTGSFPGAGVYRTATQSINDATDTAILFTDERFDTDAMHDNSANTSRLTCVTAGTYVITGSVAFQANVTGERTLKIRLNGTIDLVQETIPAATGGSITTMTTARIYQLAVGDYIELVVRQNSGGALNINATSNRSPEFAVTYAGSQITARTPHFKVGSFTPSAGTGNKAITGVGFQPSLVQLRWLTGAGTTNTAFGEGWMDAAGNQFVLIGAVDGTSASENTATDGCIGVPAATTNSNFFNKASFVSMDADGFTINFTTHGGALAYGYVAFG